MYYKWLQAGNFPLVLPVIAFYYFVAVFSRLLNKWEYLLTLVLSKPIWMAATLLVDCYTHRERRCCPWRVELRIQSAKIKFAILNKHCGVLLCQQNCKILISTCFPIFAPGVHLNQGLAPRDMGLVSPGALKECNYFSAGALQTLVKSQRPNL